MSDQATEVRIRRAPKFGAFMVVGGLVGFLATLLLTAQFPADPTVGFPALVAYFSLFGIPIGVALGALLALILNRRATKRARIVEAVREEGASAPAPAEQ